MVENENKTDVFNKYLSDPSVNKTVMFFGHSLDATDADIIKSVISVSNQVYILWHDKKAKNKYIKNLIDMFGKEEFMSLFFDSHRETAFIKQDTPTIIDENFKLWKELLALDDKHKLHKLLIIDDFIIPYSLIRKCAQLAIYKGPSLGFSNKNTMIILKKLKLCLAKIKCSEFVKKREIDETSCLIKKHLDKLDKYRCI